MITRVSSHQPSFFPWAGFWNKFARSDVHIMSCGVQFAYGDFQNRVKILDFMATLPVEKDAKHKLLKDVQFKPEALPKVLHSIRQALTGKKWPGRRHVEELMTASASWAESSTSLCWLNSVNTVHAARLIGLESCRVVRDMEVSPEGRSKTDRLIARVRRHVPEGRIQYLAGSGALGYIEVDRLPPDFEFLVQRPKEGAPPQSILQLIAQNDVASAMSDRWFEWTPISPRRGTRS